MEIRNTTTLEELLTELPELEESLTDLLPGYEDLRQAPLKDSVRKILTMERIAVMNRMDVSTLLKQVREKTGQPSEEGVTEAIAFETSDPEWIKGSPIESLDGVEMLERGEHPVGAIEQKMQAAQKGDFILLKTNFPPQPLIEAMQQQNYRVYSRKDLTNGELFLTFILKE